MLTFKHAGEEFPVGRQPVDIQRSCSEDSGLLRWASTTDALHIHRSVGSAPSAVHMQRSQGNNKDFAQRSRSKQCISARRAEAPPAWK